MKIIIAGGTGFLGSCLAAAWRGHGHEVTILTRRPRGPGQVAWSPADPHAGWVHALEGADLVVNLAGEGIADRRWTAARKALILESRVRATRALAAAVTASPRPPATFMSASGVGIYGVRGDEPVAEDAPPGSDFLASVCRAWEAEANAASAVTRVVLLRTGLVLDRDAGALPQMAMPFRFFAGGPVGSGRQYLSWIHLADWTGMVQWAAATTAVSGAMNLTAPLPVTNAEFSRALGRAMHRPAWMPVPGAALRLAFGELADALLLGGQRVLPEKATRLGYTFAFTNVSDALADVFAPTAAPA
jgi:uncharacterized protein (TIGR01777 family)